MAESYIIPDDENEELIRELGAEVELKTFKTNTCSDYETPISPNTVAVPENLRVEKGEISLTIVCIGETINWSKGMYIKDYLQLDTTSPIGLGCSVKRIDWKNILTGRVRRLKLEIYSGYRQNCQGAIITWGPKIPSSLESAVKLKKIVDKRGKHKVPSILVTDNVTGMEWIGPRGLMESRNAMNYLCHNNEFIKWFEMLSRDLESGEESVFGQAVSRLVE